MAAMSTMMLGRLISQSLLHSHFPDHFFRSTLPATGFCGPDWPASMIHVRCASSRTAGDLKKSRLPEVQRLLYQAEERYKAAGGGVEPIPKITIDHVTVGYARSGGSGGQNFNKAVNTKVDMRFNVKNAHWLNEKVKERIMQMEKGRISKDGEIVISSSKTRAQQGNEDALAKLRVFTYQKRKLQAIIDAASYVPPPPSEETMQKIAALSALGEEMRSGKKKAQSQKKALKRS